MKPKTSHEFARELLALPDLPIFHLDPSFADRCDEESDYTLGAPSATVEKPIENMTLEEIEQSKERGFCLCPFITISGDQLPDYDRPEAKATVLQGWVNELPRMQQTVLLTAVRGPDGIAKYAGVKMLLRWYRRCVLLSALDGRTLVDPCFDGGGSFTGPSLDRDEFENWEQGMNARVDAYLREVDAMPHHFHLHLMHAIEICGYKHSDERIRRWWCGVYERFANDAHLHPETEAEMDERLGDTREGWLRRADPATAQ